MAQKVYIILVNWNGWQDTIECLESICHLDYPNYAVVVCDNASSDNSIEQIQLWAQGRIPATSLNPNLTRLMQPATSKPIFVAEQSASKKYVDSANAGAPLVLIQTGSNLGFAGGNNAGLRYALAQGDCEFAWLLNSDTVVAPEALSRLVERMSERPEAGICGSTLADYWDENRVQACGGASYNRWFAKGTALGAGVQLDDLPDPKTIEQLLSYVIGASMLVRRSFLQQIGFLNEEYFLYFEEIDWATRASGKFSLAYSAASVVYHKEGRSIGSSLERSRRSLLSEHYTARNRLLFTRRYYPSLFPFVAGIVALTGLHRLLTGSVAAAKVILNTLVVVVRARDARPEGRSFN